MIIIRGDLMNNYSNNYSGCSGYGPCMNNSLKAGVPSAGIPTGIPAGTPMNPFPMGFHNGCNAYQVAGVPQTTQPMSQMPSATPGAGVGNGAGCQMTGAAQGGQPLTTVDSIMFTPGYLRTQIGKTIRVEFLIGNNMLVDRMGTLVAVGASYIIIREIEQDDLLLCDIYSIKFVRIYY